MAEKNDTFEINVLFYVTLITFHYNSASTLLLLTGSLSINVFVKDIPYSRSNTISQLYLVNESIYRILGIIRHPPFCLCD